VERRFKIDDAVGAVAVHGYAGFLGVCAAGVLLWGYPSSPDALLAHEAPWASVTPWGQFIGAMIMFWGLGFIPGYILSYILKATGLLRVPREVELAGLDYHTQSVVMQEDREIISATLEAGRSPAPAQ
jgi:ammonia channel protein AmtB